VRSFGTQAELDTPAETIAIINAVEPGSAINRHFRKKKNPMDLNSVYGRHLYRLTKAGLKDGIRAIFWHQGETDANYTNNHLSYKGVLNRIYSEWLSDYPAVEQTYLFQINAGCGGDKFHSEIREIQRKIANSNDNIHIMSTAWIPGHDGCHYDVMDYLEMAKAVLPLVERDFYQATETKNITAPNIQAAFFTSPARDEIIMEFDMPVVWPSDTLNHKMRNYFYLNGKHGNIASGIPIPGTNQLRLILNKGVENTDITYLPAGNYNGTADFYKGPWVKNKKGIGAQSLQGFYTHYALRC